MHKKVEARGEELLGREKLEGKKPGRSGRQRVSATLNQEDRSDNDCGEHTLKFVLQLMARPDKWVLWPRMNNTQRSKKDNDRNPLHCWVCGGRLE